MSALRFRAKLNEVRLRCTGCLQARIGLIDLFSLKQRRTADFLFTLIFLPFHRDFLCCLLPLSLLSNALHFYLIHSLKCAFGVLKR